MNMPGVRFKIGDRCFAATATTKAKRVQCPDCLGERVWACSLPSGEQLNIQCPTCHYGWDGSTGFVDGTWEGIAEVIHGTVGSVRVDTGARAGEQVVYMLEETGVGTGRAYYDRDVFSAREDAEAAAATKASEATARLTESNVMARNRKKHDRPGSLVAYLRSELRRLTIDQKRTREHLERITTANKAAAKADARLEAAEQEKA